MAIIHLVSFYRMLSENGLPLSLLPWKEENLVFTHCLVNQAKGGSPPGPDLISLRFSSADVLICK